MEQIKYLRRRFLVALVFLLIAAATMLGATFAWYVYTTSVHTTSVRMAAGAGGSLQISNQYDGSYSSSVVLDSFVGTLVPVSTDRIQGGFQRAAEFISGGDGQPEYIANSFDPAKAADYYMTSLYLRTSFDSVPVYISKIGYEDSDENRPISSAIRVGFAVHAPGRDSPVESEYIFAISDKKNPEREYNTASGQEGFVLSSDGTEGQTVPFSPYTSDNYCSYDPDTGVTTLKADSLELCRLQSASDGATQVDIYIWLEGCDEDCTTNLAQTTLKNVSVSFSAYTG